MAGNIHQPEEALIAHPKPEILVERGDSQIEVVEELRGGGAVARGRLHGRPSQADAGTGLRLAETGTKPDRPLPS